MKYITFILPFIALGIILYPRTLNNTDPYNTSDKNPIKISYLDSIRNFENLKNEWKKSNIRPQTRIGSEDDESFNRYPCVEFADSAPYSLVLNYEWPTDLSLSTREMFIEISDIREIEMKKIYEIPNKSIKIKVVNFGLFSSFELFKGIEGTIVFDTLGNDYAKLDISLTGDLSKISQIESATIIDQELNILKDYSCYKGYAPENKLGVNLDSIRGLESVKNNDYSWTDISTKTKIVYRTHKDIGDDIIMEIDSTLNHSLVLENGWRLEGGHNQEIYIEIFDTTKIELGIDYTIPNELFKVQGIVYGAMRGSEFYKNLNGIIHFERLHEDYTVVDISLEGRADLLWQSENETILEDRLYMLKGFAWQRDH